MFVLVKAKDGGFLSPFLLSKYIKTEIGDVVSVKSLPDFQFMINTKTSAQADKLLNSSRIGTRDTSFTLHPFLNTSKGLVRCRNLCYLDDSEIVEELKECKVVKVERFLTRGTPVQGEKGTKPENQKPNDKSEFKNTGTFLLTFSIPERPERIIIGHEIFKCATYYPRPMFCRKCAVLGHTATKCEREAVCINCSSPDHVEANCKEAPKCRNCNGNHSSSNKLCPKYKTEQEIIKIKIDQNISWNMARNKHQVSQNLPNLAKTVTASDNTEDLKKYIDNKFESLLEKIEIQNETIIKLMQIMTNTRSPSTNNNTPPTTTPNKSTPISSPTTTQPKKLIQQKINQQRTLNQTFTIDPEQHQQQAETASIADNEPQWRMEVTTDNELKALLKRSTPPITENDKKKTKNETPAKTLK